MKTTRYLIGMGFLGMVLGTVSAEPHNLTLKNSGDVNDTKQWQFEDTDMRSVKTVTYNVPLHNTRMIRLKGRVKNISKGDPKIANILLSPPNHLFVQGKKLGTTNVMVWDARKTITQIINIEVTHDLENLKAKLYELLPDEPIHVRSVQKNIVLSGEVSGLDVMQAAVDLAQSYLGSSESKQKGQGSGGSPGSISINAGNSSAKEEKSKGDVPHVINLMSVGGGQQVMLAVTIAEIDRSLFRGLDVNFNTLQASNHVTFGALNGGGTFAPIISGADAYSTSFNTSSLLTNAGSIAGPLRTLLDPNQHSIDAAGVFLSAISGEFAFNLTVDAAKNQRLAKILAEPVLTTLSGQEATFISGGEFPIPVPQSTGTGSNSVTIKFKEFGITMKFIPVVLDSGRINLNMNVGVSELSEDVAVLIDVGSANTSFSVPSLTKREASSTLELADGQTMSIAGLISEKVRSNVDKFPGLGDIPVLGTLFRSEQFLKDQTELVFFVTPRLAKPILAKDVKLPTDNYVEPNDLDFYMFGSLESRNADSLIKRQQFKPHVEKGGLEGNFGHQLIEEGKPL